MVKQFCLSVRVSVCVFVLPASVFGLYLNTYETIFLWNLVDVLQQKSNGLYTSFMDISHVMT